MGGGSSSSNSHPVEAPNSLISDSLLKITDLLCEGPISGFAYMGGPFGGDPLTATYFNDVQFRNSDGSYNFNVSGQGFQFSWTLGTTGQMPMSGFEHITTSVPLPSDTRLSNPPINAGLPKTLIVTFNTQQYPDANTVLINFRIPEMYTVDTSNGNTNGFEVDTSVYISLNGASFSLLDSQRFVGKNTTPYFRTCQYTLPITNPPQPFYQWTLRIQKSSQDQISSSTADDIYVDSIEIIGASKYNYPNSALVGLYIDALQFGTVPARSYLINGLLISVPSGYTPTQYTPGLTFQRQFVVPMGNETLLGIPTNTPSVYNGITVGMPVMGNELPPGTTVTEVNVAGSLISISQAATGNSADATLTFSNPSYPAQSATAAVYPDIWNGTFVTGVWTDNPAWVFYDFVTNTRYGLGQYINTANIDIWTLYQLSQYCDKLVDNGQGLGLLEPQFTINTFIRDAEDAYSMLLNLASAFRGMLYYANGTIRANTTDNKTPVFNYTNANVIGGVFNYSSTARGARHNSVQIKYTDVNNLYRDNYIQVQDPIGIAQYGYNSKQISAFGCASLGQATRLGNWILTTERLRTETVTFQVGEDGLYMRPGDVFNLYDNFRMNRNQGGRVVSFDTTQQFITLDRSVNLDSGCIYALTCLVPTFNLDTTGDVTGSNQIPLIRNPQIQSCEVLNADLSGLTTLQVTGGFSGLSINAVWILSCSGVYTANYVPSVFEQAPQYECLAITQSSPGIYDVVALNYNTGINFTVNTGFTTIMNPVNSGNLAAPLPVTNFTGHLITGILSNSSFYNYLNLTWSASLSSDVAYYTLSGDAGDPGVYTNLGVTTSTGFTYISPVTGLVDFKCCSVGKGGGVSAPQSTTFNFIGAPGLDTAQIRAWMLPDGFGDLEQVAIFYNRPSQAVTNTRIFFATGSNAPFTEVLDQSFYPVEGVSISGLSTSGTTAYFNTASYDQVSTLVSQGAIQQAQNTLLFLVDEELMSMGPITGLNNGQYAFSMSRGVLGTFPTVHSTNVTGWVFYSADINSFTSQSLVQVFNATGYDTGVATRYFQIENNTALLQGSIVPPAPGFAYILPNPTPLPPSSLTATSPGGPIVNLRWTPSPSLDVLQYQIWRGVSPFTTFTEVGFESSNTFFDDTTVTIGTTYEYYLLTEAQNEETSVKSNIVTVTVNPIPTGANLIPPASPMAPVLFSSGYYNASDGSVMDDFVFTLAQLPAGAVGQYLLYGLTGSVNLLVANDIQNSGFSTTAKVNDLTPGSQYIVATQAYTPYGILSQVVTGSGGGMQNAYLAPSKTVFTRANPPSNVQFGPAQANQVPAVPPFYTSLAAGGTLFGAATGSWTPSPDNDIAFYEYYVATAAPPPDSRPINYQQTIPSNQSYIVYYTTLGGSIDLWVRAINTSGGTSTWTVAAVATSATTNYAGTLGAQNSNATQISQVQIGDVNNSSITKSLLELQTLQLLTTTGAGPWPTANTNVNVDISAYGFSIAPDIGFINLDAATHGSSYRRSSSTSTNAVVTIYDFAGASSITSGENFTASMYFEQYA